MYGCPGEMGAVGSLVRKNVIDLFAGVGGLSLGAARAGFSLAAAVEIDKHAVEAHRKNFPHSKHLTEDIGALSGPRLLELSGLAKGQLTGLVGGPPCQGFSEMGLRSDLDPRNELLVQFFRLVSETRPAFFLAENVPGVISPRNAIVLKRALDQIPAAYKVLSPIVVAANDYGAPTTRTRVFFYGYDPSRVNALTAEDFAPTRPRDVRVRNALEGLPPVRSSWQSEPSSWRSVGTSCKTHFGLRLSGLIPHKVGHADSIDLYRKHGLVSGFLGTAHGEETIRRFKALAPGERDAVSKCMRLDGSGYCPTLRAGTGPERGSYQAVRPVHPSAPRVITPREAARLQGFPDWFQFHATKWHAFRQIGNSVSPIVAESLLRVIADAAA